MGQCTSSRGGRLGAQELMDAFGATVVSPGASRSGAQRRPSAEEASSARVNELVIRYAMF